MKCVAFKALSIDAAYVNSLKELGYTELSDNELISMKGIGVDAAYIKMWHAAGYKDIPAQDLVAAPRDAWPGIIERRDALSAVAARALYPLAGLAKVTALAVHAHECRDVRFNIQVVSS